MLVYVVKMHARLVTHGARVQYGRRVERATAHFYNGRQTKIALRKVSVTLEPAHNTSVLSQVPKYAPKLVA